MLDIVGERELNYCILLYANTVHVSPIIFYQHFHYSHQSQLSDKYQASHDLGRTWL